MGVFSRICCAVWHFVRGLSGYNLGLGEDSMMFDLGVSVRAALVAAAMVGFAGPAQAVITTYSDLSSFMAALPQGAIPTTDSFVNDIASAQSITFDSGVISTNDNDVTKWDDNEVQNQRYRNAIDSRQPGDPAADGANRLNWTFPSTIIAFGFEVYGVNPIGPGNGQSAVELSIDDGSGPQMFRLHDVAGGTHGFAGFISTTGAFSQIEFMAGDPWIVGPGFDVFQLANLVFVPGSASQISTPATLSLFLLGTVVLGATRLRGRVRNKVAQ